MLKVKPKILILTLVVLYLPINYGLYKLRENGVWHPLNIHAVIDGPGGDTYTLQRFKNADTTQKVNTIFIGSSHAYRGLNPTWIGGEGINLGSSSQTPVLSYQLLKSYIPKHQPKRVIMDIFYVLMQDENGVEGQVDLLVNRPINFWSYTQTYLYKSPSLINTANALIIDRLAHPINGCKQDTFTNQTFWPNGFVSAQKKAVMQELETQWPLKEAHENQLVALKNIEKLCGQNSIELILVSQPLRHQMTQNNWAYRSIHQKVKQLNIPFLDFSADRKGEFQDFFYDDHHLNEAGVKKYNTLINNTLKNR